MQSREERRVRQDALLKVHQLVEARLLAIPGVRSVGVGLKETAGTITEQIVFRVYVERKKPKDQIPPNEVIPDEIEGYPTDVLVWEPEQLREDTDKYRPVRGGIQITNGSGSVGTLGCLATRDSDGSWVALSNEHVMLAGDKTLGGDLIRIAQPSTSCCCCCISGYIGQVLDARNDGTVDCAIASITGDVSHIHEIVGIGGVAGTATAVVGDTVRKRGRTTELTSAMVVDIAYSAPVAGTNFTNQISIADPPGSDFSTGGDSGSAIINEDGAVVGLLMSGNDSGTRANHIAAVETALGITIPDLSGTASIAPTTRRRERRQHTGNRILDWEEALHAELSADHPLSRMVASHVAEAWDLIQRNRAVGVCWQRSQGPAFTAAFHRTTRNIGYRVPEEIQGVSLSQLLLSFAAALEANGSAALKRDLREVAIAWIPELQRCRTATAIWERYQILKHEFCMERVRV